MTQFATAFRLAMPMLVAAMLCSVPAAAQEGVGGRPSASGQQLRMWWNDNGFIIRLKLNGETRAQMDEIWEGYQTPLSELRPGKLRSAYYEALRAGNLKEAEARLPEWADTEKRLITLEGDLRLGVLALLSKDQLADFMSATGGNLGGKWRKRARWPIRPRPFSER